MHSNIYKRVKTGIDYCRAARRMTIVPDANGLRLFRPRFMHSPRALYDDPAMTM